MRTLRLTTLAVVLAAGLSSLAAAAGTPPDVPVSYLFSPAGKLARLKAGVAYQAMDFPIPFRVTAPDGSWGGAQWKQNQFTPEDIQRQHLTCSTNPKVCAPPYYGWITLGQGFASAGPPRSLIIVLSSFSRTPSVTATVKGLRTRGHGATYAPISPVKVGGFFGIQFDGQVVGPRHAFIPFSARTNAASGFGDGIYFDQPAPFRFIVLNVRGKTVVVLISSLVMKADEFAAYLPKTAVVVGSLRFPA
jgi:hypothetical protein